MQVKTLQDTLQTEPLNDTLRVAPLEEKAKRLGETICGVQAKAQVVTLAETPLEKKPECWEYTN